MSSPGRDAALTPVARQLSVSRGESFLKKFGLCGLARQPRLGRAGPAGQDVRGLHGPGPQASAAQWQAERRCPAT
jgi:hypothetical protein